MRELARRSSVLRMDDTDLHWVEAGHGPPLVLLHGLSDSHLTWSRVLPLLARGRRVLMPDLPGHGYSGRPEANYSLAWHARTIARWLGMLGVERADVVGHSYGGGVAQWMLLEARDRVRRLGLVAAGGLGRSVHWALRLASLPAVVERAGQPFMGVGTRLALKLLGAGFAGHEARALTAMNARPGSARTLARTARDVIGLRGQQRGFFQHADRIEDLPPVGLFWGEKDPVIPVRHAERFARKVEGVTFRRFARCGHFPHREQPGAFASALGEWLDAPALPPARLRPAPQLAPAKRSWLPAHAGDEG